MSDELKSFCEEALLDIRFIRENLATEIDRLRHENLVLQGRLEGRGTWPNGTHRAFVEGAKWWQFTHNGSTMFPSEVDQAAEEAERRYGPVSETSS